MRYSRLIAAFVFSAVLVISLCVPSLAAASEEKIIIDSCEASYGDRYFKIYSPQVNRDNYAFPQIKNPYDGDVDNPPALSSITLLGYTDSGIDWKEGYIYTFTYTVAVALVQEDVIPTISLGIATLTSDGSAISEFSPVGDVTYTYTKNGSSSSGYTVTYSITSVVKVDSNFNNGGIQDYQYTYVALNIAGIFQHSSANVTVLANRMKATKAIGEDAYYQASIDAINDLPKTEYDYIYNSMPDSEGEADVIMGQLEDMYAQFNPFLSRITELFSSDVSKPCMYIPTVDIPFLDIRLFDAHIFYFDDYLNTMSPDIMPKIEVVLWFIRFGVCVTFIYVTYYKFVKIEWWI